MPASSKSKNDLYKLLEDMMRADMGILPEKGSQGSEIDEALSALNSVNTNRNRKTVKKNLKQAGGKLFSTTKRNSEGRDDWALRANLASSCLSLIYPNLAIGISDWVLEQLKKAQTKNNEVLKVWAKYNMALAFKEVKSGRDQAEKELKQIQGLMGKWPDDSLMKTAKAAFKLPALIQLCEIHIDRQEYTRFNKRKKELLKILEATCNKQCESSDKKCILFDFISETGNQTAVDFYQSYMAAVIHLICLEYQILSLRAESRKEDSEKQGNFFKATKDLKRLETIATPCLLLSDAIQYVTVKPHLANLKNKLFLVVLEYINEALVSISETSLKNYESLKDFEKSWQDFENSWGVLVDFVQKCNTGSIGKRLFPERFEWWTKIVDTIIRSENYSQNERSYKKDTENQNGNQKDFFWNLIYTLKNDDNSKVHEWIEVMLKSLLIREMPDLKTIKNVICEEQMKEPERSDPVVEKQLWRYRKAIGLFNDYSNNRLRELETNLIKNFVCKKEIENGDRWLVAQLCGRRRFLEENNCWRNGPCLWPKNKKAFNLNRVKKPLEVIFEGSTKKTPMAGSCDVTQKNLRVFGSYLDGVFENKKKEFKERLLYNSCHKGLENRFGLTCLRRWQSFTPALSAPQKVSRGGGYFVFKCGPYGKVEEGIIIDPGLYFLENFFEEGFSVQDIDAVLLTHHHIDHRDDLESILTLIYETAKTKFPKNIQLMVTSGAWDDIGAMVRRNREIIDDIYTIEKDTVRDGGYPVRSISIDWKEAYHNCFDSDCVGYSLRIKNPANGFRFTGDTVYTPNGLWDEGTDAPNEVVMLNLGGIVSEKKGRRGAWKLEDLRKSVSKRKYNDIDNWILETSFLENHLYLAGALQLLCDWKEKVKGNGLVILCELPEELSGGHRKTIAKTLEVAVNGRTNKKRQLTVLPEDVGLRISFSGSNGKEVDVKIECLFCSQRVAPEEILVVPWGIEERLMFICRNCKEAANPYLLEEKFQSYKERGRPFEKAKS